MKFWDSLTLAFKGGGGHTRPPLGRSYIGTYGRASFSGEGDGEQTRFSLVKNYGDGEAQQRLITRPVRSSILVAVDGAVVSNWSLGMTGQVVFDSPPVVDAQITAGFLFDVPVRFAADQLDVSASTYMAGDIAEVHLIEVREAP